MSKTVPEVLKEMIENSSGEVHTILRHVSRSGMTRHIDIVIIDKKSSRPLYISNFAAEILEMKLAPDGSLKVGGAGMDMGYHIVYQLSHALYGDGYKLAQQWL